MAVTPLTPAQRAAVDALVASGRFLKAALDKPPGDRAAGHYDRLRRARNQQRYQAAPVGRAEADLASQTAQALFDAAIARGLAP